MSSTAAIVSAMVVTLGFCQAARAIPPGEAAISSALQNDQANNVLDVRAGGGGRGGGGGGQRAGGASRGNVGQANVNRGASANRNANVNRNANANRNASANRNANVNRNTNVNRNANVNRNVTVGSGGWSRPGNYSWRPGGAVAAGAAIGFVSAATAAAWAGAPPASNLCWYYTDSSRTQGFWDTCP